MNIFKISLLVLLFSISNASWAAISCSVNPSTLEAGESYQILFDAGQNLPSNIDIVASVNGSSNNLPLTGGPRNWSKTISNGSEGSFSFDFKAYDNDNGQTGSSICSASVVVTASPTVTSVSPTSTTSGVSTTYTVYGSNLPSSIAMSLEGATNCGSPFSVSSTSAKITCTTTVTGNKRFYIASSSGGSAISGSSSLYVNLSEENLAPEIEVLQVNETPFIVGQDISVTFRVADMDENLDRAVINWGDGQVNEAQISGSSTIFDMSHIFSQPGEYLVKLTVNDAVGMTNSVQSIIQIVDTPLVSSVNSVWPTSATSGINTSFTVYGTNLPNTIALSLEGSLKCTNPFNVTVNSASISCIPASTGIMRLYVGNQPNGNAINGSTDLYINIFHSAPMFTSDVAISNGTGGFSLTWNPAIETVDHFKLYRSTSSSELGKEIYKGGKTSYIDTGLQSGVFYYYTVVACNNNGCTKGGGGGKEYTNIIPPLLNDSLGISAVSGGIMLSWSEASDYVSEYVVYKSTSNVSLGSVIYKGKDAKFLDTENLENGVIYWYTLKACNDVGCSDGLHNYEVYKVNNENEMLYEIFIENFIQDNNSGVYLASCLKSQTNFNSNFSIKNMSDSAVNIDQIALTIYDKIDKGFVSNIYTSSNQFHLESGDSKSFNSISSSLTKLGEYELVVRVNVNSNWRNIGSFNLVVNKNNSCAINIYEPSFEELVESTLNGIELTYPILGIGSKTKQVSWHDGYTMYYRYYTQSGYYVGVNSGKNSVYYANEANMVINLAGTLDNYFTTIKNIEEYKVYADKAEIAKAIVEILSNTGVNQAFNGVIVPVVSPIIAEAIYKLNISKIGKFGFSQFTDEQLDKIMKPFYNKWNSFSKQQGSFKHNSSDFIFLVLDPLIDGMKMYYTRLYEDDIVWQKGSEWAIDWAYSTSKVLITKDVISYSIDSSKLLGDIAYANFDALWELIYITGLDAEYSQIYTDIFNLTAEYKKIYTKSTRIQAQLNNILNLYNKQCLEYQDSWSFTAAGDALNSKIGELCTNSQLDIVMFDKRIDDIVNYFIIMQDKDGLELFLSEYVNEQFWVDYMGNYSNYWK